jgi:hypothetical protein
MAALKKYEKSGSAKDDDAYQKAWRERLALESDDVD